MPVDPGVAKKIGVGQRELADLVRDCEKHPAVMAEAYAELVFTLRRIALDPDIDNVHHARNYARKTLTRMSDWRQQDAANWKLTWRNDRG